MMTVLLVFKTLSMLFESIRYHYLGLTGAAEAWSIVYYLFAFLKGITLFVVVLLIGSGWSLIKPFLHSRDKRIIMVVLSLQVSERLDRCAGCCTNGRRRGGRGVEGWVIHGGLSAGSPRAVLQAAGGVSSLSFKCFVAVCGKREFVFFWKRWAAAGRDTRGSLSCLHEIVLLLSLP